jgi:hypothetical protein
MSIVVSAMFGSRVSVIDAIFGRSEPRFLNHNARLNQFLFSFNRLSEAQIWAHPAADPISTETP